MRNWNSKNSVLTKGARDRAGGRTNNGPQVTTTITHVTWHGEERGGAVHNTTPPPSKTKESPQSLLIHTHFVATPML